MFLPTTLEAVAPWKHFMTSEFRAANRDGDDYLSREEAQAHLEARALQFYNFIENRVGTGPRGMLGLGKPKGIPMSKLVLVTNRLALTLAGELG